MSRKFFDKILDNSYADSSVDYQIFGQMEVDGYFKSMNPQQNYDDETYSASLMIEEKFQRYVDEHNDYRSLLNLRANKQNIESFMNCFYNFYNSSYFDSQFMNDIEYLVFFCEYFKINYNLVFENLLPDFKNKILVYLDNKYNVLNNNKFYQIF